MYVKSSAGFVKSLHTDENTRLGQNVCWQQDVGKTMHRVVYLPLLIIMQTVAVTFFITCPTLPEYNVQYVLHVSIAGRGNFSVYFSLIPNLSLLFQTTDSRALED